MLLSIEFELHIRACTNEQIRQQHFHAGYMAAFTYFAQKRTAVKLFGNHVFKIITVVFNVPYVTMRVCIVYDQHPDLFPNGIFNAKTWCCVIFFFLHKNKDPSRKPCNKYINVLGVKT